MKKISVILLAVVLAAALGGCKEAVGGILPGGEASSEVGDESNVGGGQYIEESNASTEPDTNPSPEPQTDNVSLDVDGGDASPLLQDLYANKLNGLTDKLNELTDKSGIFGGLDKLLTYILLIVILAVAVISYMVNKNILKKLNKLEKSNTSDNDAQRNTGFPNSMERARQEAAQRDEKTAEAIREMVHMLREIQSGQLSGGGRADAPQKTPEPNRNAPSGRQHYGNEQDLFNAHLKQSAQLTDSFKPASFVLASGGVHEDENANVKPFYKIDKGKEQFDVYPAAHCLNSRAERLRIEILFELPPNADSAPAMQLVRPCKLFKTSRGLYEIDQKGKLSL